jgi:hypothetical protein
VWSKEAQAAADKYDLAVIRDRRIDDEDRHASEPSGSAGHPKKLGVHVPRRRKTHEDNRKRTEESGYILLGGGGSRAGGGRHAVVDEKKMARGRPSPRTGPPKRSR